MIETLKMAGLSLLKVLIKPIAKLLASAAIKLVLLTKTKDDDAVLKEMAKNILDGLGD